MSTEMMYHYSQAHTLCGDAASMGRQWEALVCDDMHHESGRGRREELLSVWTSPSGPRTSRTGMGGVPGVSWRPIVSCGSAACMAGFILMISQSIYLYIEARISGVFLLPTVQVTVPYSKYVSTSPCRHPRAMGSGDSLKGSRALMEKLVVSA